MSSPYDMSAEFHMDNHRNRTAHVWTVYQKLRAGVRYGPRVIMDDDLTQTEALALVRKLREVSK